MLGTLSRSIDTPKAPCPAYILASAYFVNAEPASLSEAGPSATKTLPSSSTPTPSPVAPWFGRLSAVTCPQWLYQFL